MQTWIVICLLPTFVDDLTAASEDFGRTSFLVSNVLHREKSDALILDTHAIGPLKPRAFHGRITLYS